MASEGASADCNEGSVYVDCSWMSDGASVGCVVE